MSEHQESTHRKMERKLTLFAVLTTGAVLVGGIVELVPLFSSSADAAAGAAEGVEPYSPLEQAGRDIYVREGCYNCHSQMVRPMRSETLRFGEWSRSHEYIYDRPFQLGSRRIGPDLHREATRYNDTWHYLHLLDPRSTSPGSIMPAYGWLFDHKVDLEQLSSNLTALRTLGAPYTDEDIENTAAVVEAQAMYIVDGLDQNNIEAEWDDEIIALIAYLQSLGRYRPLFPELEGVTLGEALFVEMNCRQCHGDAGVGGIENPNYANGSTPALNILAERLALHSADDAVAAIELLTEGVDADSLLDSPPWDGFEQFANNLDSFQNVIRHGSPAGVAETDGPTPISMPAWRNQLNDHRINQVIAYLISLQDWSAER